jgi:DtxR family Mn-dependent transcriptional regulator
VVSRVTADGPLRLRLFEMGFVPGTVVVRRGEAPLEDPLTVDVRGSEVALRRIEAASVWICACPE